MMTATRVIGQPGSLLRMQHTVPLRRQQLSLSQLPSVDEIEGKQGDTNDPLSLAQAWQLADPRVLSYSEERNEQRLALATFFFATNGDLWANKTGWLSYDIEECEWFSRASSDQVCDSNGNYVYLHLDNNRLMGMLPAETSYLSNLQSLDLSSNSLKNTIPSSLQTLTNLDYFNLGYNAFNGSIPVGLLTQLTNLRHLSVNSNLLKGTIHSEVGNLQR
jgi:Leucine rich repeat